MTPEGDSEPLRISEASERINLPESTIRYYDREFGEFLDIERGTNNQRLFSQENLEDLTYIRYLIKREDLSVDDVKKRLRNEQSFGSAAAANPAEGFTQAQLESELEGLRDSLSSQLDRVQQRVKTLLDRLDRVEERQEKIHELLDMNIKRYNQIVEELSL